MNEPVTKELVIHKIKHNLRRLRTAIKWIIFSILSGLLIGMVGIAFYFGMTWAVSYTHLSRCPVAPSTI